MMITSIDGDPSKDSSSKIDQNDEENFELIQKVRYYSIIMEKILANPHIMNMIAVGDSTKKEEATAAMAKIPLADPIFSKSMDAAYVDKGFDIDSMSKMIEGVANKVSTEKSAVNIKNCSDGFLDNSSQAAAVMAAGMEDVVVVEDVDDDVEQLAEIDGMVGVRAAGDEGLAGISMVTRADLANQGAEVIADVEGVDHGSDFASGPVPAGLVPAVAAGLVHVDGLSNSSNNASRPLFGRSFADAVKLGDKTLVNSNNMEPFLSPEPQYEGDLIKIKITESVYPIMNCASNLIGRFTLPKGSEVVTNVDIRIKLSRVWNPIGDWRITPIGKGFFDIHFENVIEKDRIWSMGSINLKPGIFKLIPWMPDFNPGKYFDSRAQVWIKLYDLPLDYWAPQTLFEIAKCFGRPIRIDEATKKKSFGHYARILVDIDLDIKIVDKIIVAREGFQFELGAIYENLPPLCKTCGKWGHVASHCRKNEVHVDLPSKKVFRPILKETLIVDEPKNDSSTNSITSIGSVNVVDDVPLDKEESSNREDTLEEEGEEEEEEVFDCSHPSYEYARDRVNRFIAVKKSEGLSVQTIVENMRADPPKWSSKPIYALYLEAMEAALKENVENTICVKLNQEEVTSPLLAENNLMVGNKVEVEPPLTKSQKKRIAKKKKKEALLDDFSNYNLRSRPYR